MTAPEIREEVLDILSDIAPDEDLSGLVDDKPFREQLELDSMDFLDIVMELRKRHRIQIPEEDYQHLASLASTVAYLEPRMKDMVKKIVPCTTPSSSAPVCLGWPPASGWRTTSSGFAFSSGTIRSAA